MNFEKEFEKMNNEKKGQLIDAINNALMSYDRRKVVCLSDDVINDDSNMKVFLSKYVRTDDEVFEGMLDYLEITCSTEYLNREAIIDADNDYRCLIDDLHLNVNWIFECSDYDDLIKDGVLVELL